MSNPYILFNTVTGDKFYNRTNMLNELLKFEKGPCFITGLRRTGKTSILLHISQILKERGEFIPLYCSLSGHNDNISMGKEMQRVIEEVTIAKPIFKIKPNLPFEDVIEKWMSYCDQHNLRSFLLIDEPEKLLGLDEKSIAKLDRMLKNSGNTMKTIMAGTPKFFSDEREWFVSFHESLERKYIGHFDFEDIKNLVSQSNNAQLNINVSDEILKGIYHYCAGHPCLIQFVCYRLYQSGINNLKDIDDTTFSINSTLESFFKIDFGLLTINQKKILTFLASAGKTKKNEILSSINIDKAFFIGAVEELINLGVLHHDKISDAYVISYAFFSDWIKVSQVQQNIIKHSTASLTNIVAILPTDALEYLTKLRDSIDLLQKDQPILTYWDNEMVLPGSNRKQAIQKKINEADLIIGLVSQGYLKSNSETFEIHTLLKKLEIRFIPIIAKSVFYANAPDILDANPLPRKNGVVLSLDKWGNQDEAWEHIIEEILKIINAKQSDTNK